MTSKIDFFGILVAHFRTLRNDAKGCVSLRDIISFYLVPAGCAAAIVWGLDRNLSLNAANFLATIFSIFVGLLLNLLVLIVGLKSTHTGCADKRAILEETFANISYSILLSVLLIVLLFLSRLLSGWSLELCSALAWFMVGNFMLTMLMILKRVHTLLAKC